MDLFSAGASDAAICRAAADRMTDANWGQGVGIAARGRFCAIVHVREAARELEAEHPSVKMVGIVCRIRDKTNLTGHAPVPTWNDEPGRTRDDVSAMLREAASLFEKEDGQ